jgi:hypothetical protein
MVRSVVEYCTSTKRANCYSLATRDSSLLTVFHIKIIKRYIRSSNLNLTRVSREVEGENEKQQNNVNTIADNSHHSV